MPNLICPVASSCPCDPYCCPQVLPREVPAILGRYPVAMVVLAGCYNEDFFQHRLAVFEGKGWFLHKINLREGVSQERINKVGERGGGVGETGGWLVGLVQLFGGWLGSNSEAAKQR